MARYLARRCQSGERPPHAGLCSAWGLACRGGLGEPKATVWGIADRGLKLKIRSAIKRYGVEYLRPVARVDGAKVMPRPDIGPTIC